MQFEHLFQLLRALFPYYVRELNLMSKMKFPLFPGLLITYQARLGAWWSSTGESLDYILYHLSRPKYLPLNCRKAANLTRISKVGRNWDETQKLFMAPLKLT